jgi:excisionase family DNA binding protein
LTLDEVATICGVSRRTVEDWIDQRLLAAFDISTGKGKGQRRRLRVNASELQRFMEARSTGISQEEQKRRRLARGGRSVKERALRV